MGARLPRHPECRGIGRSGRAELAQGLQVSRANLEVRKSQLWFRSAKGASTGTADAHRIIRTDVRCDCWACRTSAKDSNLVATIVVNSTISLSLGAGNS